MKTATGNSVLRAYGKAAARLKKSPGCLAATMDAGFIFPKNQKRGDMVGYQVFVKVSRFSTKLLKEDRMTGGLLEYKGK